MLEQINSRELKLFEVLGMAFLVFTKLLSPILTIVCILFFPISILNVMIADKLYLSLSIFDSVTKTGTISSWINQPEFLDAAKSVFANQSLQLAVHYFLAPVGIIAVAMLCKQYLQKQALSVGTCIGDSLQLVSKYILAGIPCCIFIIIGFIAFGIPGFYLTIIWFFYLFSIGLAEQSSLKSLGYSRTLVNGRFFKTALAAVVITLSTYGFALVFDMIYVLLPTSMVSDVVYVTLCSITNCFGYIAITILFLNREAIVLGKKCVPAEATPTILGNLEL